MRAILPTLVVLALLAANPSLFAASQAPMPPQAPLQRPGPAPEHQHGPGAAPAKQGGGVEVTEELEVRRGPVRSILFRGRGARGGSCSTG